MIKTRTWVTVFAAAALLLAAASYYTLTAKRDGMVAQIVQDGAVLCEIDLSRVEKPYSFTVESADGGCNTVLVEPGRICVSEADCPDRICVRQGWLNERAAPIVCLPHRLSITLKGAAETDAVAR